MLYYIVDYNYKTKVAHGVQASQFRGEATPSGLSVPLRSTMPLHIGATYSFVPKDESYQGLFIRGELDYSSSRSL
jgi:hypothetical protein